MAARQVLKIGNPRLLEVAEPVTSFNTSQLDDIINDMFDTMAAHDGAGLAAPQIGINLRIVIFGLEENPRYPDAETVPTTVLINPQLMALDNTIEEDWEGCLSIPDIREDVTRPEAVTVRYQDLEGQVHEERVDGLLARVLQHEIDHLNGVLFIDRISPIKRKLLSKKLKRLAAESQSYIPSTG